eukprot:gene21377-27407_t
MIVRNSEWSLQFLSTWWTAADRSTDAINSRFPVNKHHNEDSRVLHLAGASSAVRRHVGVDHTALQLAEMETILRNMREVRFSKNIEEFLITVDQLKGRVRDAAQTGYLQSQSTGEASEKSVRLNSLIIDALSWLYHTQHKCWTVQEGHLTVYQTAALLQSVLEAGFELLTSLGGSVSSDNDNNLTLLSTLLDQMEPLCVKLKDIVTTNNVQIEASETRSSSQIGSVLYYQFKLHEFRANSLSATASLDVTLQALERALSVWHEMVSYGWYGSGNGVANRHREGAQISARIAWICCELGGGFDEDMASDACSAKSDSDHSLRVRYLHRGLLAAEDTLSLLLQQDTDDVSSDEVSSASISSSSLMRGSDKVVRRERIQSAIYNVISTMPTPSPQLMASLTESILAAALCSAGLHLAGDSWDVTELSRAYVEMAGRVMQKLREDTTSRHNDLMEYQRLLTEVQAPHIALLVESSERDGSELSIDGRRHTFKYGEADSHY